MGRKRFGPRPKRDRPPHRINHHIRLREIRVIGPDGESLGVMSPDEGRAIARQHELDLVEVSPNVRPSVCKVMDYGKFKYEKSKASSKSAQPSIKTVQMRPKTDDHDLHTKLSRARRFLKRGDKVKIVMRLRGRENAYPERWVEMMREHFREGLSELGRLVSRPSQQGRMISMMVEPI